MKRLVNTLSGAVRRAPWVIVIATVAISLVLGGLSGQFLPAEDQNDAFAPDAPELAAVDRISELFGAESSTSVMQVIVTAEDGNLFSVAGLDAVSTVAGTIERGSFRDILAQQPGQGPILSFMAPVEQAIFSGAPVPATDAELQQLFLSSLGEMPQEQAGFIRQLLSSTSDLSAPTAEKGLLIAFTTGATSSDEFDAYVALASSAAAEIQAANLPEGFTAEAFSFELLFGDQDEFQSEIGRLFATAGLIILIVLSLVFLILPHNRRKRALVFASVVTMAVGITLAILPSLATVLPSLFPDSIADWPAGPLLLSVVAVVLLILVVWSVTSKALRRTTADTLLTLVAIFFAIAWMNGIGYLLYEDQSPMAQILPILLIGLGVDYSIHVSSRYREEMAGGASVDAAVAAAIRTVGIALVLATITTAVGFLTNVTNAIPALREFGVLAAIGIGASFLLMLTLVPAIRYLLDRRPANEGRLDTAIFRTGEQRALPKIIGRTSIIATKLPAVAIVASLLLGGLGYWGWSNIDTKFSFLDFIPTTSPLRDTFGTLLTDFGGGFGETTQIVIEGDVATADSWNALLAASQNLSDTPNVVTFGGSPAGSSPIAAIAQMTIPETPTYIPSVAEAVGAAGIDQETFVAASGADLSSVFDAAFAAAPDVMGVVLHSTESGYDAALFDITTQAGEAGAGQLRLDVMDDFAPVREAGMTAVGTSDEIINDVVVTTLRESQVSSLYLTLLAALILLVINFLIEARRPMLGVITTVPVALVVLWSFGLMTAFGIPFGPVTATISALGIGIGIPYMIHITHRYLEDRDRSESAEEAIKNTLTHTGGALAGSALTTIAGFGILTTSTTIPFRQFGFVTAYTILLAMLAAILVLPSLLVVWDRWHRRRGEDPFDRAALHDAFQDAEEVAAS